MKKTGISVANNNYNGNSNSNNTGSMIPPIDNIPRPRSSAGLNKSLDYASRKAMARI